MSRARVVVVDDHPLFRQGVVHVLTAAAFDVVGEGASAADAIKLAREHRPDVLTLDLDVPGGGLIALQAIMETDPRIKVLILTISGDGNKLSQVMASGGRGYVVKGAGVRELVEAVGAVAHGQGYISPALAARVIARSGMVSASWSSKRDPLTELTYRESQVFTLVAQGLKNKEIGGRLNLTEKTVKHYVTRIFGKLQVRNRVEAALLARAAAVGTIPTAGARDYEQSSTTDCVLAGDYSGVC